MDNSLTLDTTDQNFWNPNDESYEYEVPVNMLKSFVYTLEKPNAHLHNGSVHPAKNFLL